MNDFLTKVTAWLRAGYPDGVPRTDYLPLFALLRRQLTVDEIKIIAEQLASRPGEFDDVDIGGEILAVIDDLPDPVDVERVRERLIARGWPLDDPHTAAPTDGPAE